jgi:hypothetical protein
MSPWANLTLDEIAEAADRGEDISRFFTNSGKMIYPSNEKSVDTYDEQKQLDKWRREDE